jgi:hypothetical protein
VPEYKRYFKIWLKLKGIWQNGQTENIRFNEEIFMTNTPNVPRDLQKSFSRLIDLIPSPSRYKDQIQKDILLFLKLDGEEFVRNRIEQSKAAFSETTQRSSDEVQERK